MSGLFREIWLLSRDHAALFWLALALLSASLAVFFGLGEIARQRTSLAELIEFDRIERETVFAEQADWGDAAYYTFHLTYDAPSDFAFAAIGRRDASPWKHRVRMLALEGQIYEADANNPDFALTGRFDFAFVAAFLAPLFLILLLHNLRSGERAAGRGALLDATSARRGEPWRTRSVLRTGLLALGLLAPLWVGGLLAGSGAAAPAAASGVVLLHLAVWWMLCRLVDARGWSSPVNLTALIGVWMALAIITPSAVRMGADAAAPVPEGGEIVLTQREAVNDAWDLPKESTMDPFVERHPRWREHARVSQPFEWKWYYAFQQVGDQTAEPLSLAYREGRRERDRLAGALAWLSPPALTGRAFRRLAGTDLDASLAYERRVRDFHAELRAFYYPRLFLNTPFSASALDELPRYGGACADGSRPPG